MSMMYTKKKIQFNIIILNNEFLHKHITTINNKLIIIIIKIVEEQLKKISDYKTRVIVKQ